jgi:hypothetical protein|tara:strand:- start:3777 stop:3938 length:162 start_codon:yes stop_codon:yes gene_type:complete
MQIELKPLYLNAVDAGCLVGFAEGGLSLTKKSLKISWLIISMIIGQLEAARYF